MKYIIEFSDDDRTEFERMLKATDLALALWKVQELVTDLRDNKKLNKENFKQFTREFFDTLDYYDVHKTLDGL